MRDFALAGLLLAQLLLAAVLPASAYPGLWKGALGCDGPCRWPPLGLVRPASRAAPAGPLSFADRIDTYVCLFHTALPSVTLSAPGCSRERAIVAGILIFCRPL